MSEETSLALMETLGLVNPEQLATDAKMRSEILEQLPAYTSFQSIKLCGKSSKAIEAGLAKTGDYMLYESFSDEVGRNISNMIPCIPLAYRPLAIDYSDPKNVKRTFKTDDEYVRIKEAATKGSFDDGYMYGLEVLLLLCGVGKAGEDVLVTYYLASNSARGESASFMDKVGKQSVLTFRTFESKKYGKIACPKIEQSPNPISIMMETTKIKEAVEAFRNPEKEAMEEAAQAGTTAGATSGREV